MDAMQPLQALMPDRPLLGVWVLVTCLAGGAATQNLAVVPHTVDQVDFRFAPGQSLPDVELGAAAKRTALVAPPAFRQFRQMDRTAAPVAEAELMAPHPDIARDAAPARALDAGTTALASAMPEAKPIVAAVPLSAAPQVAPPLAEPVPALAATPSAGSFETAFAGIGDPSLETILPEAAAPAAVAAPALANPPELRGFDLARVMPSAARRPSGLIAPRDGVRPSAAAAKPSTAGKRDRLLDATVYHPTTIMIGGQSAGRVDVRIGADMKPSIKVGDLLGMVSAQMDPELAAHLSAASGASDYVSFATLRDAGFKVSYNAGADSVSIGVAD